MGQLIALQSKLNSTMKAHYEHRGASSRRDLARFKNHICKTQDKIADLETQFKLVISNVDSFLKSHTQEQDEIITRHRQKEEIQEKEKDFPNVENEKVDTLVVERQDEDSPDISKDAGILKDKSVSFLLPIKCSS